MMRSLLVIVVSVLVGVFGELEEKCPKEDIKPCTCRTYFDGACIITCSLVSDADLQKVADIPDLCSGHVHFVLVHTKVSGIPAKLWRKLLSSKTVDISIRHVGVDGLLMPDETGSDVGQVRTPGEAVIKIDHTKVQKWDWTVLNNFYSEGELSVIVDDTPMGELSPDFGRIANGRVHKVTLDSVGLTTVPDKIFVPFDQLTSLSLQNNKLTFVSRDMLQRPAKNLEFLHLNGNELTTLPSDLFAEMPALQVVYLRENKLQTLPDDLFKSISSKNLYRIDFVRNPWTCDCKLLQILTNTKQHVTMGTCASPESLANQKVRNLAKLLSC